MTDSPDPFAHHPELRERIVDPLGSFFRDFRVEALLARHPELEAIRDWVHSDSHREALRARVMAGHSGDLWIFAYGSLMWDPALRFAEVLRATVAGYSRRLILVDDKGARGTKDAPGLMAALDHGTACEGLVYRIAPHDVDAETEILWRREVIGPGYIPRFLTAVTDDGPVQALAFVADHSADSMQPDLTRAEQVTYLAHGTGFLGTSRDYLANIVGHFETLGIHDEACVSLLREVDAYLDAINIVSDGPNEDLQ